MTVTEPDRDRWKRRLLELRAEIVNEGDVEIEPVRDEADSTAKVDDDAQPLAEMQQVIASKRNRGRADVLGRIQRALRRLEQEPDLFGLCGECEEPIGKRLDLLPYVELCVECQQARDGGAKPGRRRHLTDFK